MKDYFTEVMSEFLIKITGKLDLESGRQKVLAEVVYDFCMYFDFGCAFIYTADYQGLFRLTESFQRSSFYDRLAFEIPLKEQLGNHLYDQLCAGEYVMFNGDKDKSALEQALAALFQASSLLIVPIHVRGMELPAFIGMTDRRARTRSKDQDIEFAYFVMAIVANYVGTMMARQRSEGSMNTLRRLLDHTGVDVYVIDFETFEILYANESIAKPFGGSQNLIGKKCWEVLQYNGKGPCQSCPKPKLVDEDNRPARPYIWNYYQELDETWKRIISSAFYWVDGRLAISVSKVDITENQKNEAMIRYYAEYDVLTGLPNRHKLLLDCDDGLERLKQEQKSGWIIFCDLNRFKLVNDIYGHAIGDELLRMIGSYFERNEQTRGRTYRYGGDEFVILCLDHTKQQIERLIKRLDQDFNVPWELSVGPVRCSCSCGYTSYPEHALTTTNLLHTADAAMYEHKKATNHGE